MQNLDKAQCWSVWRVGGVPHFNSSLDHDGQCNDEQEWWESIYHGERETEGSSPLKTFLWVSEDKRQELCILNKIINNRHSDFIVHTKLNLIWSTVALKLNFATGSTLGWVENRHSHCNKASKEIVGFIYMPSSEFLPIEHTSHSSVSVTLWH